MSGRCPRWGWLLLIATVNLVIWLGLAYAVARLSTDGLNPGVEVYLRQGQATAGAYLGARPAARATAAGLLAAAGPEAAPAAVAQPPAAQQPGAPSAGVNPAQPSAEPQSGADSRPSESQAESPARPAASSGDAVPAGSAAGTVLAEPARESQAAAASSPAAAGLPMVLADPGFGSLMAESSSLEQAVSGQVVRIHYAEAALNREIATLLAANPDLPYGDVYVQLQPDRIVVNGRVTVLGLDMKTELLGILLAEECEPRVEVQAVSVGGLLTPRFIKNQASSLVFQALDWYPPDAPLCLEQIVVEQGSLTVYGYRR